MTRARERAHAILSASGAHRWLVCPPSALLEQQFPDTQSEAAAEGTLAHEIAEGKLRNYFQPEVFTRQKLTGLLKKWRKAPLWADEMAGYTEEYLDYVKAASMKFTSVPYAAVEKRVDFSFCVPDGFGTADCILIGGGVLHIIDFKYGKQVPVSAEKNPQMMLYALGAWESYRMLYPIQQIRLSIVQPRIPDGISEWELSLEELSRFAGYAAKQAALAIQGEGEYKPDKETCRFCRAKTQCRARAEENVRQAFQIGKKPPLITAEEVGRYLLQGADVAAWLSDLQDWALAECLAGNAIPGWKAVEGRGSRVWADVEQAFQQIMGHGIPEAVLWKREPLYLDQDDKELFKKELAAYVGYQIIKKPGKPTLLPETDKRAAITNRVRAEEAFAEKGKERAE